jgi:hypothetical protein
VSFAWWITAVKALKNENITKTINHPLWRGEGKWDNLSPKEFSIE